MNWVYTTVLRSVWIPQRHTCVLVVLDMHLTLTKSVAMVCHEVHTCASVIKSQIITCGVLKTDTLIASLT